MGVGTGVVGIDRGFWRGKRVFLTGHTGFKGSWLCLWLHALGAEVSGYALEPPTEPSLYRLCDVDALVQSTIADVRDLDRLAKALRAGRPEIVIHMAAQPLVRDSYRVPVDTYEINVMGTVHLLEAVRRVDTVRAVINVTTDKCYENREWVWGYREQDHLGGYDPYSNSKACSELVTAAYRTSYFNPREYERHRVGIASARAGNVIGGGDFAPDRLLPDCVRAVLKGEGIHIRYPQSIRPWQFVLEPLSGYLLLAQQLVRKGGEFSEAWNFGPDDCDAIPVADLVRRFCDRWGRGASFRVEDREHAHEAGFLKLDCSKARARLAWAPRWDLVHALDRIVEWTRAYEQRQDLRAVCRRQIEAYEQSAENA